ncbi:unannotated protein [freshwater metagenome]|uniref:Unannotated protein n=1 Tax=freshwater metagenome TaxID=449393 RepID=A0A6J7GZE0_9ZZZZ
MLQGGHHYIRGGEIDNDITGVDEIEIVALVNARDEFTVSRIRDRFHNSLTHTPAGAHDCHFDQLT